MADDSQELGGQSHAAPVDLGDVGLQDLAEIGRGGFATVYRARQTEFDRIVAVKVLTGVLDDQARSRLDRERRALGALSAHPNIVAVYGSGFTTDGQPYIVMEFAPGGSLADRLSSDGAMRWEDATEIGVKLSEALGAAHRAGVLHRDLKPENVLVSEYGEPMLADFGIARVAGGTETRTGVVTMSLAHAAPEVLEGARPTEMSDIYSLASTIHALIAGRAPFVRDTDESMIPVIARIATEAPPDLREQGVPDSVCDVLERSMAKDPDERYATAAAFTDALRGATTGETGNETSASEARRKRARHRTVGRPAARKALSGSVHHRNWPRAIVALLVVLVVAVGGVVVATGGGNKGGNDTVRVAPSKVVAPIAVNNPLASVVGEGALWVLRQTGSISRVDPAENAEVAEISQVTLCPAAVNGEWVGEFQSFRGGGGVIFATIEFTDTTVSGFASLTSSAQSDGSVGGTVACDQVSLEFFDGITTATGTLSPDGSSISGQYDAPPLSDRGSFEARAAAGPAEPLPTSFTSAARGPAITVGEGAVWSTTTLDNGGRSVQRVDPQSNEVISTVELSTGLVVTQIATGENGVWLAARSGFGGLVFHVDPVTDGVVADIAAGRGADAITVGFGSVWVADTDGGTVFQIDPQKNEIAREIEGARLPALLAAGEGALWVFDIAERTLLRIDPETAKVNGSKARVITSEVEASGLTDLLAVGLGSIWLVDTDAGTLVRIDPETLDVLSRTKVGRLPSAVAVGEDSVWVLDSQSNLVFRVTP